MRMKNLILGAAACLALMVAASGALAQSGVAPGSSSGGSGGCPTCLTDTQLRATPVSVTPSLATGAATSALQTSGNALLAGNLFVVPGTLPTITNRSGTATTTSGGLTVAANASRRGLVGQNISAVNVCFNEFAGTAACGTAGSYTVTPGSGFSISGTLAVNFIAASGTAAVTMTEY